MKIQYQLSNGSWVDETNQDEIQKMIDGAIKMNTLAHPEKPVVSQELVLKCLANGKCLRYGESWNAKFVDADAQKPEPEQIILTVKCSCGHTVEKSQVMNGNFGTMCPKCYDNE